MQILIFSLQYCCLEFERLVLIRPLFRIRFLRVRLLDCNAACEDGGDRSRHRLRLLLNFLDLLQDNAASDRVEEWCVRIDFLLGLNVMKKRSAGRCDGSEKVFSPLRLRRQIVFDGRRLLCNTFLWRDQQSRRSRRCDWDRGCNWRKRGWVRWQQKNEQSLRKSKLQWIYIQNKR